MSDSIIQLTQISKRFGSQTVLDQLDFAIGRGTTTVILGRSGSGKSVLLKHMIGLLRPDQGAIWVDGTEMTRLSEDQLTPIRRKFGLLFQDAALFDSMTVADNVAFPLREHTPLTEAEVATIVAEKLEQVGLNGSQAKLPSQLSGGMRKRVGLARAIALDPEIILYDEPTTGLDPVLADGIGRLIRDTQQRLKVTSVVISHDMSLTFSIADKIAMLYRGKIIEQGTPEEFQRSRHPVVRQFLDGTSDGPESVM